MTRTRRPSHLHRSSFLFQALARDLSVGTSAFVALGACAVLACGGAEPATGGAEGTELATDDGGGNAGIAEGNGGPGAGSSVGGPVSGGTSSSGTGPVGVGVIAEPEAIDPTTDASPPTLPVPGNVEGPQEPVTPACVTSRIQASVEPAYVAFLMDRSDSMDDDGKWTSCSSALRTFFSDSKTKGLYGSLTAMPFYPAGVDKDVHANMSCTASDYAKTAVAMTALPSAALSNTIASMKLFWGTPTRPALKGTLTYAEGIKKLHPSSKVVTVLATDGLPVACANNEVADVADVAASYAARIPTYVIGVGSSLSNLNAIAKAGGTGKAILVSTASPTTTSNQLLNALGAIRRQLSCEYTLPKPTSGVLNVNMVNVSYASSVTSKTQTLAYNAACAGGAGWRYDDVASPSKIQLCSETCRGVAADPLGKIDIVFGCPVAK